MNPVASVSVRQRKPFALSKRTENGASTVEAILVIVPLFLLVFIVIEFTVMLHTYHAVVWTTEYAVREASGGMGSNNKRLTADDLRNAEGDGDVQEKLSALTGNTITGETICIQYSKDGESWEPDDTGEPPPCTSGNPSGFYGRGDLVRVFIEAPYKPMLPNLLVPDITFRSTFERSISIE